MNDSRWVIFVAIARLVFARNLDITILELQNSICFPAVLGNIMLFDSDSFCYFCDSIPCRELDTLLAETASHSYSTMPGGVLPLMCLLDVYCLTLTLGRVYVNPDRTYFVPFEFIRD